MFFLYSINTQYLPLPVYDVPAIRVNTTKSTYTFTSVMFNPNVLDYLISDGELSFKRKTLYIKHTDRLVLEKLIIVPSFPTSSTQTFHLEVCNRSNKRTWQISVPSIKVCNFD